MQNLRLIRTLQIRRLIGSISGDDLKSLIEIYFLRGQDSVYSPGQVHPGVLSFMGGVHFGIMTEWDGRGKGRETLVLH